MANSMMFRCRQSRRVCAASGADIVARGTIRRERVIAIESSPHMASWLSHRLLSFTPFRGLSGECRHMPVILTTKARTRISIHVAVVLGCLGAGGAIAPLAAFE